MSILDRPEPKVVLPKNWPRLARSAIVHAIALARLVVTHVRGWCADSPLKRVRLAAECERLRSEVAMLREELRIKDAPSTSSGQARLARIPAKNRPHYPPTERLAVLALKAARGWAPTAVRPAQRTNRRPIAGRRNRAAPPSGSRRREAAPTTSRRPRRGSSSNPPRSRTGSGASTRRGRTRSYSCRLRSTSTRSSSATSFGGSRRRSRRWGRSASPTC